MSPFRLVAPLAALLLLAPLALPAVAADGSPPVAVAWIDRATGIPEIGDGLGTEFRMGAGMSYDPDGTSDEMDARWDWEGDGAWDTPWTSFSAGGFGSRHAYAAPGTYSPRVVIRDADGNTDEAVAGTLIVEAPRTLALGGSATGTLVEDLHRHDYTLVVPQRHLDVVVTLDVPAVAGVNLDLYLQTGPRPDVHSCSPPACRSSTSLATEGQESICLRFVAPGTFSIAVVGRSVATAAAYTLSARADVFDATTQTATCMYAGPVPVEYVQDVLAHPL